MALQEPPLKQVAEINIGKNEYRATLNSNIAAVRKQVLRFTKRGVRRAEFRALNRAASQTLTQLRRILSKDFNLAQKEFKSHLSITKANFNTLFVAINGRGHQIPISRASGTIVESGDGVRINTGGGPSVKRGAFIATMPNGHAGVFQRKPDSRHKGPFPSKRKGGGVMHKHELGISELKYPPVSRMITNSRRANTAFDQFTGFYEQRLLTNLNAEATRLGAR